MPKEKKKEGICPVCHKGPRKLLYRNPDDKKQEICPACYARITRYRSKGINRSLPQPKLKKEKNTTGRKIKYPNKEAVEAALKSRTTAGKENYATVIAVEDMTLYRKAKEFGVSLLKKEIQRGKPARVEKASKPAIEKRTNTPYFVRRQKLTERQEKLRKKNGRKPKYPTRESVIVILENRKSLDKDNFPSALQKEESSLYRACSVFEVELPRKGVSYNHYYFGDLVTNQNPKDPGICGEIGKVVYADEKRVKVDFKEAGRITRVYEKWYNLGNIVLHTRNTRRITKKPK